MSKRLAAWLGAGLLAGSGGLASAQQPLMEGVSVAPFGKTAEGKNIEVYTLQNKEGMSAKIMTYGAIVTSIKTKDRDGKYGDVVLGFDNLDAYLKGHPFFGAIAGRYANRIAKGKFTLDGKTYSLFVNNGPNSLHGGKVGFDKQVWRAKPIKSKLYGLHAAYFLIGRMESFFSSPAGQYFNDPIVLQNDGIVQYQ